MNSQASAAGFTLAQLRVYLEPAATRSAGARWRIHGRAQWRASGSLLSPLTPWEYTLEFSTVAGFKIPVDAQVVLASSTVANVEFTYELLLPPTITGPPLVRRVNGPGFAFALQATSQRSAFAATSLAGTNFTLNPATGTISCPTAVNGAYPLMVTATNAAGTSTPLFLVTIIVSDPGQLQVLVDPNLGRVAVTPPRADHIYPQGTLLRLTATGTLSLKLGKLGQFTGTLRLGAMNFPVRGQFLPNGMAQVALKRRGFIDRVLMLTLDAAPDGTARITGTLPLDGTALTLSLERAVFDRANPATAFAGAYTLIIPRDPLAPADATPHGHGFGSVVVTPLGAVRFAGTLGDGTAVTQSAFLSNDGLWPFHAPLYGKRGVITGDLLFRDAADESQLDGELAWIKPPIPGPKTTYPGGFDLGLSARGSRYDKTLPVPDGTVSFGEGNQGVLPAVPIAIAEDGRITPAVGSKFTMRVAAATGLFNGTFQDPATNQPHPFRGALFQLRNEGFGLFPGGLLPPPGAGLSTGFVELNPPP